MIEINGWVSINISTDGERKPEMLQKIIDEIDKMLRRLETYNQFFKIESLNGVYTLYIGLNHNHNNGYDNLIYNLLKEIGMRAPGSFGIVYIRDDEDEFEFNKFKVLKMAKGIVTNEDDKFISPCNPIIED